MPKTFATPGPRSIYPEMCDSRSLSRCSLLANALWPRLVVQSDDQGRLHGDAADIRGLCFPKMPRITSRAVGDALAELAEVGSIIRYEVDGEPYVQIGHWWEYQSYQRRAFPSRFPAPQGWRDIVYGIASHPETYEQATAESTSRRGAARRGGTPPRAQAQSRPVRSGPVLSKPVQSKPARGAKKPVKMTEQAAFGETMAANGLDPSIIRDIPEGGTP